MANSIPPAGKFDFSKPDAWSKWIKRYERYVVAANITEETIKHFATSMGQQAEDILLSFNLSAEDANVYAMYS